MSDDNAPILVYTTLETPGDAQQLGRALVGAGLAACVNIFPAMTAIYEWEGALDEAQESAMLIKSRKGVQERLLAEAKRLHPYEKPALIVLQIAGGDAEFFNWIAAQTGGDV